jgi:hypothetical protein
MKNADTIHELTRAEIARQISALVADRAEIAERRRELFARSSTGGGSSSSISVDERAALVYAKARLGGSAPPSLDPPSELDFSSMDRQLAAQQRGCDIAIKILSDKELAARAAEAVQWAEANLDRWRHLARETIVAAARLEAVERAAAEMIAQCVDVTAINLPMANMIGIKEMRVAGPGFSGFMPVRPDDLIEAGLQAGLITRREIDKARNV